MAIPASPSQLVRTLFVLTTSVIHCIASSSVEVQDGSQEVRYGVLVDAGSTSAKLDIYRWDGSSTSESLPRVRLVEKQRFKPGIHKVSENPDDLLPYMVKILDKAKQDVPAHLHADTPIFVMATAGLRYLTKVDSEAVLQSVREILLREELNPFSFAPDQVQVLSGEREGAYAWAALNYLAGNLQDRRSANETFGILEMGGGSTQIAFLPSMPLYQEEFQVRVFGKAYNLYAQSYLHFGAEAINKHVYNRLGGEPGTMQKNPCMLKGDKKNVTVDTDSSAVVTYVGTGKPVKCREILTRLLRPAKGLACSPKPCAIGGVYQPRVEDMKFYASQGFTYTPKTLNVLDKDGRVNITQLRKKAEEHCRKSLDKAVSQGMAAAFASQDCLMGIYIPILLTLSYGFEANDNDIVFAAKIGDERIDWSLGAILVELSKRESARTSQSIFYTSGNSENDADVMTGNPQFLFLSMMAAVTSNVYFSIFLT